MTTHAALRPLAATDTELLRTATLANVNWTGEQRFTYHDVDRSPELRHYARLRPERGDFGAVAEQDGVVVGVVWALFLAPPDPGYGFVAEGVPEVSLSVWPGYRGRGTGRALLSHLLEEARTRGLERVALSVEEGNPVLGLYRGVGFVRAPGTAARPTASIDGRGPWATAVNQAGGGATVAEARASHTTCGGGA